MKLKNKASNHVFKNTILTRGDKTTKIEFKAL